MRRHLFAAALACAVAAPAGAQEYTPITERETFLSLLQGRQLQMWIYGLSLNVLPDGRIEGIYHFDPVTQMRGEACDALEIGRAPEPGNLRKFDDLPNAITQRDHPDRSLRRDHSEVLGRIER